MRRVALRLFLLAGLVATTLLLDTNAATACVFTGGCPSTELDDGDVTAAFSGKAVTDLVSGGGDGAVDYVWRLRRLCVISDEANGACSAQDFRPCPQEPGRAIEYLVVQQRRVVRSDGTVAPNADGAPIQVPAGLQPGETIGAWMDVREGCIDITSLNPPPSPAEVFSYFERLPLPTLTTQHQPPGSGLTGLPVIFYTDSPTTQSFTVDIRGFTVVINAAAEQYTWHTGDARTPVVTSTDPGHAYPDQTIEHPYRSGTYTAYLTVTWGATFTVNGSAPADVPGTTTTDGPPVTFDVLQARAVLTNPYD
jgi:hypothetical protein